MTRPLTGSRLRPPSLAALSFSSSALERELHGLKSGFHSRVPMRRWRCGFGRARKLYVGNRRAHRVEHFLDLFQTGFGQQREIPRRHMTQQIFFAQARPQRLDTC
jgi:hypothetical protein